MNTTAIMTATDHRTATIETFRAMVYRGDPIRNAAYMEAVEAAWDAKADSLAERLASNSSYTRNEAALECVRDLVVRKDALFHKIRSIQNLGRS